jgi:hypothetical protein
MYSMTRRRPGEAGRRSSSIDAAENVKASRASISTPWDFNSSVIACGCRPFPDALRAAASRIARSDVGPTSTDDGPPAPRITTTSSSRINAVEMD